MKWKVLVFAGGVFFAGEKSLVENPDEAKWFDSYAKAVEISIDIIELNIVGVSQVRFISDAFENAK